MVVGEACDQLGLIEQLYAPVQESLLDLLDADLEGDDYETVAGLIFTSTGRVPKVGAVIKKNGYQFVVDRAERAPCAQTALGSRPPVVRGVISSVLACCTSGRSWRWLRASKPHWLIVAAPVSTSMRSAGQVLLVIQELSMSVVAAR